MGEKDEKSSLAFKHPGGHKDTLIFEPESPEIKPLPNEPTVIFIFGWMNAPQRALLSYITLHRSLFPRTPIVAFRTDSAFLLGRAVKRRQSLAPVLPYITTFDTSRAFVHLFSNGGSSKYFTLSGMLRKDKMDFEAVGYIFDSCPGKDGGFLRFVNAFSQPFKKYNVLLRILGKIVVVGAYLMLAFTYAFHALIGRKTATETMWASFNKRGRMMRRLYIYSDEDVMIFSRDVEAHAKEAKDSDDKRVIKMWKTEGQHVAHARLHPQEYKDRVLGFWKESLEADKHNI